MHSSPLRAPTTSGVPTWKVSPGGSALYINSVAVSSNAASVVAGTYYYQYSATQSRRGPLKAPKSSADQTFGTYCYNRDGSLRWKDEFTASQGVYWVAVSGDNSAAASGGTQSSSPTAGFVRAYDGKTGAQRLDYATAQRVNQVALSASGLWLVSGAETLILFRYDPAKSAYDKVGEYTPTTQVTKDGYPNGIVSVGISANGDTIAFAEYSGVVGVLSNSDGILTVKKLWTNPSSFSHMIDLTPDGRHFAAGGAKGVFYLFVTERFIQTGVPTYSYDTGVSEAVYGVACEDDGSLFAGVVNNGDAGVVYAVSIVDFAPSLLYKTATQRNPNSVALNLKRGLMAVADGHPDGTPGNFYLWDGIKGSGLPIYTPELKWQYTTGNMSWPVAISDDGSAVVGGSDDSYVYFFNVPVIPRG